MNEFGKLLRKLRGNMSLRDASEKTGVSFSYIGYLETGKHPRTGVAIKPSPDMLKGLAKGYGYPFKDLMIMAGYSYEDVENEEQIEEQSEMESMKREIYEIVKMAQAEEDVKSVLHVIKKALKE